MSIINDALKKAGKPTESEFLTSLSQTRDASPKPAKMKSGSFNWGPLFVLLVLVLIAGPIVAPLFSRPVSPIGPGIKDPDMSLAESSAAADSNTRKGQFLIEEMALPALTPPLGAIQGPQFELSGLVYSPANSFCILNNKIVKAGESLQGATVSKITANEVILDYEGKIITLSMAA